MTDSPVIIKSVMALGDPTATGRIYPPEVMKKAVEGIQEKIKNRSMLVHNTLYNPTLPNAIGILTKAEVTDRGLEMEAELIDGISHLYSKGLPMFDLKVGGRGTVDSTEAGKFIKKLISIEVVSEFILDHVSLLPKGEGKVHEMRHMR
jgi:hypothetical protein